MSLLSGFVRQRAIERRAQFKKALIHFEAKIGGQLFGAVPADRRREFFCLDEHTWVWHEEWTNQNGKRQVVTTRYDVRPQGVFKSQGPMQYQPLTREEARNLLRAIRMYREQVGTEYDRMLSQSA